MLGPTCLLGVGISGELPTCFPQQLCCALLNRGTTAVDGAGFGIDRPAELTKEDDEYEAFRKRMMLAYRFRPNPLVRCPRTRAGTLTNALRYLIKDRRERSISSDFNQEIKFCDRSFDSFPS